MEHKTLSAPLVELLDVLINEHLKKGWQLYRGIITINHLPSQQMTRTVIKRVKSTRNHSLSPEKIVDLWNQKVGMNTLPRKLKVIPSLLKTISTRINEKDGFSTLKDWDSYFNAIMRSSFLTGNNDRGWKADLDWAVKPKSIAGVIEKKYHS